MKEILESNYYNKVLKFIIYYNCELYIEYEKKEAYLHTGKVTKKIDYSIVETLIDDFRIELDGGDYHDKTETYRRTEQWKEYVAVLKINFPHLFRKEKIKKLLDNDK